MRDGTAWTQQDQLQAEAMVAEESLVQHMQHLTTYTEPINLRPFAEPIMPGTGTPAVPPDSESEATDTGDHEEHERPRSNSAPPLRRTEEQLCGLVISGRSVQRPSGSERPRKAEAQKQAQRLGLNRAGHGIAKRRSAPASKRGIDLHDPHQRARHADLAAARYAVTSWEDVLRFTKNAATTKARNEAWEDRPAAWDLVLAASFGSISTA